MVRPLYPPRKKAPPPPPPLWKNPQLMGAAAIVLILVVVFIHHFFSSGVIDPEALPGGKQDQSGIFSFLKPSKYFKPDKKVADLQKQKLSEMGINDSVEALKHEVEAKDLREQRRILAMRKYEATRETAVKHQQNREELRKKLSSPTSMQLKDAIMALEASDNLGIMKLESLLEEKLMDHGAKREDLDVIIYAYDSLAKVYEDKQMYEKAKEAYVNAFKLMKKKAPDEQGPDWNNAIENVEQMRTTTSRSN
ncbi:MAG: hypothetical protein PWR01_2417 [Clostridiales bacterium]|jgi:hypothetical protein|nr:hypothetical protein [Clostridiales bacterium]MDN5281344.1 hypothetical protein [Candidatus Ozemobacter sp.]